MPTSWISSVNYRIVDRIELIRPRIYSPWSKAGLSIQRFAWNFSSPSLREALCQISPKSITKSGYNSWKFIYTPDTEPVLWNTCSAAWCKELQHRISWQSDSRSGRLFQIYTTGRNRKLMGEICLWRIVANYGTTSYKEHPQSHIKFKQQRWRQLTLTCRINLTLYAPCIILQYVYKPTRCTKFLCLILQGPFIIL